MFSWGILFGTGRKGQLVASASAISKFGFMTKRCTGYGILGLAIASLLSACASSSQEGVVTENASEPKMTSTAAHFGRPSYAPGGDQAMTSGHSGGF